MDDSKTVFCGNLSDKISEEILYELFLQAAPLEKVRIPVDKEGRRSNFAFITFKHEQSVDYALQLLNGVRLYDKNINVRPRNTNSANKLSEKNDFSIQSRLGFAIQQNQFQNKQENRDFQNRQDNRESHGSRGHFRDNYKNDSQRGFRDNYRDDTQRDNSYNRHDDRDRHERSNRKKQNYNDRRGNFERGNRSRNRYY